MQICMLSKESYKSPICNSNVEQLKADDVQGAVKEDKDRPIAQGQSREYCSWLHVAGCVSVFVCACARACF
jgi:hypothetical protein